MIALPIFLIQLNEQMCILSMIDQPDCINLEHTSTHQIGECTNLVHRCSLLLIHTKLR
jgi:hypothetical protein